MRRELSTALRELDRERFLVVALSLAPAALTGYLLRGPIERRLGGPRAIATGLVLGGLAMAGAERGANEPERSDRDARPADGLALGLAQALALAPGVSRYGATLAAARARGFSAPAAQKLSWHAALPLMLGASALELARGRPPARTAAPLAVGAGAAFASTLLSARLLRRPRRALRSLLPWSLYRLLLAMLVLLRGSSGAPTRSSSIS